MSPQRIINVEQSVRVLKFLWGTFQLEPGGITSKYFTQTQAQITARAGTLNLLECLDWAPPYVKSVGKLTRYGL